jgi:hypothetical protein
MLDYARLGNLQVRLHGGGPHGEEAQGPAWDYPRGGGLKADVGRLVVGLALAERWRAALLLSFYYVLFNIHPHTTRQSHIMQ